MFIVKGRPVVVNVFIEFNLTYYMLRENFFKDQANHWFEEIDKYKEKAHCDKGPSWSLPSLRCENLGVGVTSQFSLGATLNRKQEVVGQKLV